MKKYVDNILVDLPASELAERQQEAVTWQNSAFDRGMEELRQKRNLLLQETDYLALSDQTMSAEMTTYRQALRDITNGLTTVADVEAVVFPEKPEASL